MVWIASLIELRVHVFMGSCSIWKYFLLTFICLTASMRRLRCKRLSDASAAHLPEAPWHDHQISSVLATLSIGIRHSGYRPRFIASIKHLHSPSRLHISPVLNYPRIVALRSRNDEFFVAFQASWRHHYISNVVVNFVASLLCIIHDLLHESILTLILRAYVWNVHHFVGLKSFNQPLNF